MARPCLSDCCEGLKNYLQRLRLSGKFCDFRISGKTFDFPIHKIVLAAHSRKFRAMFESSSHVGDRNCQQVQLSKDISKETVAAVVDYLYTEKVPNRVNVNLFREIVKCCKQLDIECLARKLQVDSDEKPASPIASVPPPPPPPPALPAAIRTLPSLPDTGPGPSAHAAEWQEMARNIQHKHSENNFVTMAIKNYQFREGQQGETKRPEAPPAQRQKLNQDLIIALGGKRLYSLVVPGPGSRKAPNRDGWRTLTKLPQFRNHAAAVYLNGSIYVTGGTDEGGRMASNLVYKYDIQKNSWGVVHSMQDARAYHNVAILDGKKLMVVGGIDNGRYLNSVELYDPETDRWNYASPASSFSMGAMMLEWRGKVYRLGGFDGENLRLFEVYDPDLDKWTMQERLKAGRSYAGLIDVKGNLYMVGGRTTSLNLGTVVRSVTNSIDCFDGRSSECWQTVGALKAARFDGGIFAIGSNMYYMGGLDINGKAAATVDCFSVDAHRPVQGIVTTSPREGSVACFATTK